MNTIIQSGGICVIYCTVVNGCTTQHLFVSEDEIVAGAINLVPSLKRAKMFDDIKEAEEYANRCESELRQFGNNFFVAELSLDKNRCQYLGYFGKDAARF